MHNANNSDNGFWLCNLCGSGNHRNRANGAICGCEASRLADGREPIGSHDVDVDDIELPGL